MKPLHAGLLIVGAALASGLAVKMTQPQPFPVVPVAVPVEAPTPAPVEIAPVTPAPAKPSPIPTQANLAPAPAPVYLEPPVRKNKPILTANAASASSNAKPFFVPPVPYEPAAPAVQPKPEPAPPPPPQRQVTLPAGMGIPIRLNESLSSDRSMAGQTFNASLAEPLIVDGLVIAERGSRIGGRIVGAQRANRVGGTSLVELELTSVTTSDGQKVAISTDPWTSAKIGGSTTLGAIIGAIAGGRPVNVPSETLIRFRLASRVTIRERQL